MKQKGNPMKQKGIAPVTTTILIILIVIGGAAMLYSTLNLSTPNSDTAVAKTLEALKIVQIQPINDSAIIYVQNIGSYPATIGGVYVENEGGGLIDEYNQNASGTIIPVNSTVPITINYGMNFTEARYYKIVTTRGNAFSYVFSNNQLNGQQWSWMGYQSPTLPPTHNYTYQEVYFPASWTNQNNPLSGHYKGSTFTGPLPSSVTYNDGSTFDVTSVAGCYMGIAGTFNFVSVNQTNQIVSITFVIYDSDVKSSGSDSITMFHYVCKPDGTILGAYNTPSYQGSSTNHYFTISITDANGISNIVQNHQAGFFVFGDGQTPAMKPFVYKADQVMMIVTYYVP